MSRALIGTIRATGGRVLTDAPVKAIVLDEPANQVRTNGWQKGSRVEGRRVAWLRNQADHVAERDMGYVG